MLRHPKWMPRHWMPQHPKRMPRHLGEEGVWKEDTQARCRSIQDTRAQCRGMEFGNRGMRRQTKNPEGWTPRHPKWMPMHWFCEKSEF